jgi:hypothetical protein
MNIPMLFFCIIALCSSCATTNSKNPNLVADADPIPVGKVTVEFEKFFSSSLGEKEISLVFEPRSNTVYLQFSYETVTYRQFWDKVNREKFIAALAQYQQDFEAKNLTAKGSKSRRAYGAFKGKTEWGQFSFSVNYRSYPQLELGYLFNGDNPYFTVFQREAKEVAVGGDNAMDSRRITTYYTRAQAAALAALFDQAYLLACLEEQGIPLASEEISVDTYDSN